MENAEFNDQGELIIVTPPLSTSTIILSGILLIIFTLGALLVLIGLWPDQIPDGKIRYRLQLFNVTTIDDSTRLTATAEQALIRQSMILKKACTADQRITFVKDSIKKLNGKPPYDAKKANEDLARANKIAADARKELTTAQQQFNTTKKVEQPATVKSNTLVLILVATAGFLGNMIYLSKSFTAYVGTRKFERSWILWYCVKPFAAAALAIIFYLLVNPIKPEAGHLYTVVGIAALTGLFTDMTLDKLREVFMVVVKPSNEDGPKRNKNIKIHIENIKPENISLTTVNQITIPGENLDANNIIVKINNKVISTGLVTPTLITFNYSVPPEEADKTEFVLVVTDKTNKELANVKLGVTP